MGKGETRDSLLGMPRIESCEMHSTDEEMPKEIHFLLRHGGNAKKQILNNNKEKVEKKMATTTATAAAAGKMLHKCSTLVELRKQ